jgi:glutamyl/glutaminyl-tRNA synthetase
MPGEPAVEDFTWVRGTTTPLVMRFKRNGVAVEFDDARITVYKDKGKTMAWRVAVSTGEIVISDPVNGEITFQPTAAQTRLLTQSKLGDEGRNTYEVELRNGTSEEVYVLGTISAVGGINDDEA